MKKWIAFILVLVMTLTMAGCGCEHFTADLRLTNVNTDKLTAKWEVTCVDCGKVIEKRDAATGVAPKNSTLQLTAAQWFECLTTNVKTYDSTGMLVPMAVESEDGAMLRSIVTPNGFKSVISFFDKEENVVTTEQADTAELVHRIRVEAQFENDATTHFYTLIMLMAMTNNSEWDNAAMNDLAKQIMGGQSVTDNGYTYTLEIISPITHTVALHIEAE